MEWIAIALIGWLGWQYLKKTGGPPVYKKSDAASSLQRLLEHVSQEKAIDGVPYQHIACGLIENAWQGLSSEQAWLRVSGQATDKASCTPHKITLICYALVLALQSGVEGYKRDILLLALGGALQEAKNQLKNGFSRLDFVLLESNMQFYIQEASALHPSDKATDEVMRYTSQPSHQAGQPSRFMGAQSDEEEREAYQGEAMLRAHEAGATMEEARKVYDAIGKVYDMKKAKGDI